MRERRPLLRFVGIAPGVYLPRYPVWLVAEEPADHQFVVAVDQGQRVVGDPVVAAAQRRYLERLTKLHLHQPVFRSRVLFAYDQECSVCRLPHLPLLDAAHVVPDSDPDGLPVVPNGLAMWKIHHAAYDADIIGIRPDLTVDVRADILAEIDGRCSGTGCRRCAPSNSCSPAPGTPAARVHPSGRRLGWRCAGNFERLCARTAALETSRTLLRAVAVC